MSKIMGNINWVELFPTRLSGFIFICYISLFVAQGILVTHSQDENNSYSYNTVTAVLLTEVLKLIVSTVLYCRENTPKSLIKNIIKDSNVLVLYFIPAFLYCLYNNLAFFNLATFDPTTYFLLLQLRVVITAILFQIIFNKRLNKRQWFSLILLTAGCMVKQVNLNSSDNSSSLLSIDLNFNIIFILIQTVCSCLAGVYNEYLLKGKGADVNIYVQNVFMYLDSIVCNAAILIVQGNFFSSFSPENLQPVFHIKVLLIVVNNCAVGIVTSFFLKHMNSILKTFASALELVFTAILSYILFAIPIYLNTFIAISIVSFAVYLYSQTPVVNTVNDLPKYHQSSKVLEKRNLLEDTDDELEMEAV